MRLDLFDVFVRGAHAFRLPLDEISEAVFLWTLGLDAGLADAACKLQADLRRGSTPEAWAENDWQAMSPSGPLLQVRKVPVALTCLAEAMKLLVAVEDHINHPEWREDVASLKEAVRVEVLKR